MRKENFDDSVKRILEQPEFAYDPAAWEQAQSMLAAQNQRRLGGWWWTLLFLAVSSIVGAGISSMTENQRLTNTSATAPTKNPAGAGKVMTALNSTTSHNSARATLPPDADSSKIIAPVTIRLVHPAKSATMLTSDTLATAVEQLPNMKQREVGGLKGQTFMLYFKDSLQELPKFDFNYASRPKAFTRSGQLSALAWVGQQGKNVESNQIQQQYGLGLALSLELLPGLEVQLGTTLAYHNGFALSRSKSDTTYGFGRTITTQTATVRDYLQLQLPLSMGYRLGEKHLVEVGAVYLHYLGSHYNMLTTVQQEAGTITSNASTLNGKITGLVLPDWSWFAGYRYRLNDAIDLGLRYQRQSSAGSFPMEQSVRFVVYYHPYRFGL